MTASFRYVAAPAARPTEVFVGPVGEAPPPPPARGLAAIDAGVARAAPEFVAAAIRAARLEGDVRLVLEGGEALKSLDGVERLFDAFADAGLDRRSRILAVGGGALLDAVGFAAAAWHRGTPLHLAPTTLVAQVDAALGGKSALNVRGAKNQVGFVRQPERILADPAALRTLPEAERLSGLGEVVKTALLAGGALWELLRARGAALRAGASAETAEAVAHALRYKASVVEADPEETSGARHALNLGHTAGHVLEAVALARGVDLPHGLAVAAGLAVEARVAPGADLASIEAALRAVDLPATPPCAPSKDEAAALLARDKKRSGAATLLLPIVRRPGETALVEASIDALASALAAAS
ncbi:MAG TPA: 3-dehydroquinate synthase family protein [Planctomycetota bacterium]|nr:3-dehydroquinate synthase family protein [Planctomycetota bacterium]